MVTSRLVVRCGCCGVSTPVGGTWRCGLASISTTSLSKIIGRSSDAVRRWLGSNRSRTRPSQLLASNWRIEFARGSSRLAAAVGAMIGRGRRNGQWHSHRNKFGAQRASSRSKYPVLHQNRMESIEAFDEEHQEQRRLALFPADREIPGHARDVGVQVQLSKFRLKRPRKWGACWTFCRLWEQLQLDEFWGERLKDSREGTSWRHVLMVLTAYRWIDPGSEWRLHREWYQRSAMGYLLNEGVELAAKDTLYRCLDHLLEHKEGLFTFLKDRWQDLFAVKFDVLLYDLTSTYFESDPPFPQGDKRRFGYSRDHRSDCVQVVIALIVTPEGIPLAYEVMAGNTLDKTTLPLFLEKIEQRYGKAQRIWVMDRGIPTEAHLEEMRKRGARYLVGTPKGRLSKLEQELTTRPWQQVRPEVQVKLLPQQDDLYVYVESEARISKERSMRRRKLRWLWRRLHELKRQRPTYKRLLMQLGAAKKEVGRVFGLVPLFLPDAAAKAQRSRRVDFGFTLSRSRLRLTRRREGRYLLRTNLLSTDPAQLWQFYLQLVDPTLTAAGYKEAIFVDGTGTYTHPAEGSCI